MRKYGMKYSTIKHFQDEAIRLNRTHGILLGRHAWTSAYYDYYHLSSQEVAYNAIHAAAVSTPGRLRDLFSGKF